MGGSRWDRGWVLADGAGGRGLDSHNLRPRRMNTAFVRNGERHVPKSCFCLFFLSESSLRPLLPLPTHPHPYVYLSFQFFIGALSLPSKHRSFLIIARILGNNSGFQHCLPRNPKLPQYPHLSPALPIVTVIQKIFSAIHCFNLSDDVVFNLQDYFCILNS